MEDKVLSIEQMLHLQELGVDTSNASMFYVPKLYPKSEYCLLNVQQNPVIPYIPAYTLHDIIERLPDEIKYIDEELHYLSFSKDSIKYSYYYFEDECISVICDSNGMRIYDEPQYLDGKSVTIFDNPKDLLNCAYEMLCWCAEKGYLKDNVK